MRPLIDVLQFADKVKKQGGEVRRYSRTNDTLEIWIALPMAVVMGLLAQAPLSFRRDSQLGQVDNDGERLSLVSVNLEHTPFSAARIMAPTVYMHRH
jgi:hypothetical protein